jgi:hypothetical protein
MFALGIAAVLIIGLVSLICLFVSYIYPNYLVPTTSPGPELIDTQVAETIVARLTQTGPSPTPVITDSLPTDAATPTITFSPTATSTNPPTATVTPLPPTPTPVTPTPTATPIPCNWVKFIDDVTIKDGTVFPPNNQFIKTWRLQNIGMCSWTRDYMLVFDRGERMDGPTAVQIGETVNPGESVDLSVQLVSPLESGTYRGYWMLSTPSGEEFGLGGDADSPFWVEISVIQSDEYVYDFGLNYCTARWSSEGGRLPCPGEPGDKDGFVILVNNPVIEIERLENEPALRTVPQQVTDGYLRGVYPQVGIKSGYRFKTIVGCLSDSKKCDLIFQIKYRIGDGDDQLLWEIRQVYDGELTNVDIDLTPLVDQDARFILEVYANGSPEGDNGFWLLPRIED